MAKNKSQQGGHNKGGNPNWKKGGPSPNPNGRVPVGTSVAETIRKYLETKDPDDEEKRVRNDVLLHHCYLAAKKDPEEAHRLWNRAYGKPRETIDLSVKEYSVIPAPPVTDD